MNRPALNITCRLLCVALVSVTSLLGGEPERLYWSLSQDVTGYCFIVSASMRDSNTLSMARQCAPCSNLYIADVRRNSIVEPPVIDMDQCFGLTASINESSSNECILLRCMRCQEHVLRLGIHSNGMAKGVYNWCYIGIVGMIPIFDNLLTSSLIQYRDGFLLTLGIQRIDGVGYTRTIVCPIGSAVRNGCQLNTNVVGIGRNAELVVNRDKLFCIARSCFQESSKEGDNIRLWQSSDAVHWQSLPLLMPMTDVVSVSACSVSNSAFPLVLVTSLKAPPIVVELARRDGRIEPCRTFTLSLPTNLIGTPVIRSIDGSPYVYYVDADRMELVSLPVRWGK